MRKRDFLKAGGGAAALMAGWTRVANAAAYPAMPVTLVIPFAPGGSADGLARLVSQGLTRGLGQPVIVDNRPGAGGSIAAAYVAKSRADGYTLLYATSSHAANMSLYKPAPFDLVRDYAPVTILARVSLAMVVNANSPASSVADFITWARASGQVNYGSAGNGTSSHLSAALFNKMASLQMQHVPFRGGSPANMELLAGRLDVVFAPIVEVLPYLETGKLKALGVTGPARSPRLPRAAPIGETLPGYDVQTWHGLLAPAGTDSAVVAVLSREAQKALQAPETRKQMASDGTEPVGSTPRAFADMLPGDIEAWARLVKLTGAVLE